MKCKKVTACLLAGALALSALTGCGSTIKADAVGATLNGEEISLGFLNFMARYQQAVSDGYYLAYFGAEMWSSDLFGDGTTMEASTKKQVVESIETLYLLEDHMADYGVEVTEEELAAMDEAARQFMSDNSKKAIAQIGATEEYVKEMLRLYTIQYKMQQAIEAEVDTNVTDDEAAQRTFSYLKVDMNGDYDAESNYVEFTEEEKESLAATVQGMAAAAKQDFEKAGEDAGYTVSTYSYGSDESSMDEAVIKAADALKEGEVSDLITTEKYYYIIRLDSSFDKEATEKKKETIVSTRKSDHYKEVCDGYKEGAEFSVNEDEWKKVKFDKLFKVTTTEDEATDNGGDEDAGAADQGSEDAGAADQGSENAGTADQEAGGEGAGE